MNSKVANISGSSNNRGAFYTELLSELGAKVDITDQAHQVVVKIAKEGGEVILVQANGAFSGASAYRAAVAGLTRSWAKELAPSKITVNAVMAGSINTAINPDVPENEFAGYQKTLNPLGRFGTPAELAYAVAFLASPDSGFIIGSELTIDGGMTA